MTQTASRPARPGPPVIERATPADRAFLAMDSGEVPEQFGVILLFDQPGGLDLARVRQLMAERVPAVPRLRQRLIRAPFGCGGPVWVDDPRFDIRRHVRAMACGEPGDEPALLDTALYVIAAPLPRTAPLWSAALVTGLADGRVALVLVLHHVLADGLGGLAVLANLVDSPAHPPGARFPRPAPAAARLAQDAFASRWRGLRHGRQSWRLLRASMGAGGGLRPPRAAPCSLIQRTGPRRHLTVVRAEAAALQAAAHRHGATTNDAVLTAVAGALHRVLMARGEFLGSLVMTVPVSGRRSGVGAVQGDGAPVQGDGAPAQGDGAPALGNMVSPMLVPVPAAGDVVRRLEQSAARIRARKAAATGPPPIAVLGWLFRPLAALGGYRWYMNHQHRFHTLVSYVRGPAEPVSFGGSPVVSAIPVAVADAGNVTVYFSMLSYAGTLTLTAITDPAHFPDPRTLADALRAELDQVIRLAAPSSPQCPVTPEG